MSIHAAPIVRALLVGLMLATAAPASAQSTRPIFLAPTIGIRDFDSGRDLSSEVSYGARFGIDANPRFGFLLDFVYTSPSRESTGASVDVSAVRGLARYRAFTGTWSPYVLGGVGGVLFDFSDTFDTATLTVTLGAGVEYRLGRAVCLFADGSADGYRARTITYSSTGEETESTDRETEAVLAGTAGISVEF